MVFTIFGFKIPFSVKRKEKETAQDFSHRGEKNPHWLTSGPAPRRKKMASFNSAITHWTIINENQQQMVDSVLQENTVQN